MLATKIVSDGVNVTAETQADRWRRRNI